MHYNRLIGSVLCLSYLLHSLHGIFDLMNPALRAPDGDVVVVLVAILEEREETDSTTNKRKAFSRKPREEISCIAGDCELFPCVLVDNTV